MVEKYDKIGEDYNESRRADEYLFSRLAHHLRPVPNKTYLDLGCGTGNYTNKFFENGFHFIGIEPSNKMITVARLKQPKIKWVKGYAEEIPLENESVDGAVATLTIHHWKSLEKGFAEIYRVLKPKTNFILFTALPTQMEGYWLSHYFPRMIERSIKQMPTHEIISKAIRSAGLFLEYEEKYFIRPDLSDMFLYSGKHRPEIYLDPKIRSGISSFSDLSLKTEVNTGLESLKKDIVSGKVSEVVDSYENNKGDYMFLILRKNKHDF